MCLTCGKHNADKLWYLDPEKHRIQSMGLAKEIVNRRLHAFIVAGLKLIRTKAPDYAGKSLNFVSRSLLNWFTKTLHGMQTLPDAGSAFEIIDMANELALVPCLCHHVMQPDEPLKWRCIAMNVAADVYFRDTSQQDVRAISKEQARDLIVEWRGRGAFQSVGWLWDANVIWLCNCDESCSSLRAPEVEWAGVPSFVTSRVLRSADCTGCRTCADWCPSPGALRFDDDGRLASVDAGLCRGCGLCVEHCPDDVLGFKPRELYYDVWTKSVRSLGSDLILVQE